MAAGPKLASSYRGRFAPSPTGPLHLGSLLAAVVSYLRARHEQGEWLLRMEDIDGPRVAPGAAAAILRSLEAHGLAWDGEICWQSRRIDRYASALRRLEALGRVYPCSCTRQEIRRNAHTGLAGPVYAGTCRGRAQPVPSYALRFRIETSTLQFFDRCHGLLRCNPAAEVGDVVVKRRDGLFAYVLACTIDDADFGITEIVRGDDILGFTPAQICLQRALSLPEPGYAHFPVVRGADGRKLSKQNDAPAIDDSQAAANLIRVLRLLGIEPPAELARSRPADLWGWVDDKGLDPLPESAQKQPARAISELALV